VDSYLFDLKLVAFEVGHWCCWKLNDLMIEDFLIFEQWVWLKEVLSLPLKVLLNLMEL
jgi:hypothetical protein